MIFDIVRGDVVALVGGGGKTTLRDRLAAEARAAGWRVVSTTTTKSGPVEGPCVVDADPVRRTAAVQEMLDREGFAFAASARGERRWIGVEPEWVDSIRADLIVVEADGARKKPLKAPADHEPVIPRRSTLVIAVVGAEAIGATAGDELVHRLHLFPIPRGATITPEALASHIVSPTGYRKSVPPNARFVVFINKIQLARPGMVDALSSALHEKGVRSLFRA